MVVQHNMQAMNANRMLNITFILADSEIMLGDAVGGMIINIH
jgi:hypothetical protein